MLLRRLDNIPYVDQNVIGSIPVRAHAWVVDQVPGWGVWEATVQCFFHTSMFLSLSLSLQSPLSKNKQIKSSKKEDKRKAAQNNDKAQKQWSITDSFNKEILKNHVACAHKDPEIL